MVIEMAEPTTTRSNADMGLQTLQSTSDNVLVSHKQPAGFTAAHVVRKQRLPGTSINCSPVNPNLPRNPNLLRNPSPSLLRNPSLLRYLR